MTPGGGELAILADTNVGWSLDYTKRMMRLLETARADGFIELSGSVPGLSPGIDEAELTRFEVTE